MKMFDAGKTRMIVLPYGEKTMTIKNVKTFSSDTGSLRTDRIAISISRVTVLMRDKTQL